MTIQLTMEVHEVRALEARLTDYIVHRTDAFRAMLTDIGEDIAERERDRISDDKFDPDGQPWEPWSQSYADSGQGVALMHRTGRMVKSFRSKASSKRVTIRNIAPYAKFHQGGTKKMPARPILGWGPEEIEIANNAAIETLGLAFQ